MCGLFAISAETTCIPVASQSGDIAFLFMYMYMYTCKHFFLKYIVQYMTGQGEQNPMQNSRPKAVVTSALLLLLSSSFRHSMLYI